jgi:hypothetical protein
MMSKQVILPIFRQIALPDAYLDASAFTILHGRHVISPAAMPGASNHGYRTL